MYPNMQIKTVCAGNMEIDTCSEGYIVNRDDGCHEFIWAQAKVDGLDLSAEH